MAFAIPTLDAPRVANQALPAVYEKANHTGAEYFASAVAAPVLDIAGKYAADLKNKYDGAAVEEALNKQADHQRALAAKVKAAENKDALGAATDAAAEADKYSKDLFNGLANDDQKRAFSTHANRALMQFNGIAEAHAAEQAKAFDDREFNAGNAGDRLDVNTNPDFPGVTESATSNITRRTDAYLRAKGIPAASAQGTFLLKAELAHMRTGYVKTLIAKEDSERAAAFIADNPGGFGDASAELEAEVTRVRTATEGRRLAEESAARYPTPDGMFDVELANRDARAKFPAGSKQLEVALEAVQAVAHKTEAAVALRDKQGYSTWLSTYQATSPNPEQRNLDTFKVGRDAATFYAMSPVYQHAAEEMWQADKAHKSSKALEPWEQARLRDLMVSIAEDPDKYGASDASILEKDSRYTSLPQHARALVDARFVEAHRDKNSPEAVSRTLDPDLRTRGILLGFLSEKAKTGLPSSWPAEDQARWGQLQDEGIPEALAFKKDEKNKGMRFSTAKVDALINRVRRTYTIEGGGKVWGDLNNASREEAEATNKPVHPNASDSEVERGRKVQMLRGFDPDVSPGYFTPEELIKASDELAATTSGPNPVERADIIKQLQAAKPPRPTDEASIRQVYTKTVLGYRINPPKPVLKPRVYDSSHRQGR
jgi:hypothetical protein